jgi:hypothetical protein
MINDFPENILIRLEHIIIMDSDEKSLNNLDSARFPEATFIKCLYSLSLNMDRAFYHFEKK